MTLRFTATCAFGLERLVEEELKTFGAAEVDREKGAVHFSGKLGVSYRACLWSRFSSRVLLDLGGFEVPDEKSLYDGVRAIDWSGHISPSGTIAVETVQKRKSSFPGYYASLKTKDAIVDQIRDRFGTRPSVRVERPEVLIHLFLDGDKAKVFIDLSGEGLHRRGYRSSGGTAPLKESLAAAILRMTGFPADTEAGTALVDPMCGSGTFLVEAALMAADCAPGLGRDYFGFTGWLGHDPGLWADLIADASDRKRRGLAGKKTAIIGYDSTSLSECRKNIRTAGLEGIVMIEQRDIAHLKSPILANQFDTRILVANPPYGERLESPLTASFIQRCLIRKLKEEFAGWRAGILIASACRFDGGEEDIKRTKLFNGPLPCELNVFEVSGSGTADNASIRRMYKPALPRSDDFSNRLRKNLKNIIPWAEREIIDCFRIYDSDIPEYNVAVDIFDGYVRVVEYPRPQTVPADAAGRRLRYCADAASEVMGVPRPLIHAISWGEKRRSRSDKADEWFRNLKEVSEAGMRFLVDLEAARNCGLPLRQRLVRRFIRDNAKGSRFLCLFCGSGSATVSAAEGGALKSLSLDPSTANITWSRCNIAVNGFSSESHRVMALDEPEALRDLRESFDLIFVDMPDPFRRKAINAESLLKAAVERLSDRGRLLCFMDAKMPLPAPLISAKDITAHIVPRDLKRGWRAGRCLLLPGDQLQV